MSAVSGASEGARPDGRATRWDDHKNERKQLIVRAAIGAISGGGGEVGVQQIADHAGLPRSVVYRIFKDRDDLDEQIRATIIADLMVDLAPVLALEGTIEEAINRAVTTYVRWVIENPPLHQFLGGGAASRRNTNSKVVTGTKAAIAVHVAGLIDTIVRAAGHDPAIADSMSFGLVGLVDASVNRWVAHPNPNVTSDDLIAFLTESIWLVIRAAAKNMGLQVALETPLNAVS